MLYLLFRIGQDRYAIRTDRIVAVLPLVEWKALPPAPRGVAGVFNYHGSPVPLIDIGELATQQPSRTTMSTRILLLDYLPTFSEAADKEAAGKEAGATHLLGLLAEEATTTLRRTEEEFSEPGVTIRDAPYLGPVTMDGEEIIQRVEVNQL
jgi:chemotaxis-related protein WspB